MHFFENIGLEVNADEDDTIAQIKVNDQPILLFKDEVLQSFIGGELTDTKTGNELLVSFNLDTDKEVDDLCKKVILNGGQLLEGPASIRGCYACLFTDPDGHKVNVIVM